MGVQHKGPEGTLGEKLSFVKLGAYKVGKGLCAISIIFSFTWVILAPFSYLSRLSLFFLAHISSQNLRHSLLPSVLSPFSLPSHLLFCLLFCLLQEGKECKGLRCLVLGEKQPSVQGLGS